MYVSRVVNESYLPIIRQSDSPITIYRKRSATYFFIFYFFLSFSLLCNRSCRISCARRTTRRSIALDGSITQPAGCSTSRGSPGGQTSPRTSSQPPPREDTRSRRTITATRSQGSRSLRRWARTAFDKAARPLSFDLSVTGGTFRSPSMPPPRESLSRTARQSAFSITKLVILHSFAY